MSIIGHLFIHTVIVCFAVYAQSPTGFKSALKCKEYGKRNYESDNILFPWEGEAVLPPPVKYPYMVKLFRTKSNESRLLCGGVLISERAVLTAAHCINAGLSYAEIGTGNVYDSHIYKIAINITNPQYTGKNYYNDIGLITLERSVRFSRDVQPACLQLTKKILNEDWLMHILEGREEGQSGDLVTYGATEVKSDGCQQNYTIGATPYGVVDYLQLCVQENRTKKSPMEGYGALVRKDVNTQQFFVIGVPSIALYHDYTVFPTLSTRVSSYLQWIESNVWPQNPEIGCSKVKFQL